MKAALPCFRSCGTFRELQDGTLSRLPAGSPQLAEPRRAGPSGCQKRHNLRGQKEQRNQKEVQVKPGRGPTFDYPSGMFLAGCGEAAGRSCDGTGGTPTGGAFGKVHLVLLSIGGMSASHARDLPVAET